MNFGIALFQTNPKSLQAISIFFVHSILFFIDKYSNLYYHIIVDAYKVGSAVNLTS